MLQLFRPQANTADWYHTARWGPLLLFPGALRRAAELTMSAAKGSENTGRAILGETVAKTFT